MSLSHVDLFLWVLLGPLLWLCKVGAAVTQAVGTAVIGGAAVAAALLTVVAVCCGGLAAWGILMVGLCLWRERHQ